MPTSRRALSGLVLVAAAALSVCPMARSVGSWEVPAYEATALDVSDYPCVWLEADFHTCLFNRTHGAFCPVPCEEIAAQIRGCVVDKSKAHKGDEGPDLYFPKDPQEMRTRTCRYGKVTYNMKDVLFSISIELYGEWGQTELEVTKHFLKPGMTVFDVGTHIATMAMAFAYHVGNSGNVIGFEPNYPDFLLANFNAMNNYRNIRIHNAFVGDEVTMQFKSCDINSQDGSEDGSCGEYVPQVTLDSLAKANVGFIKIDVDGAEPQVLEGARETITAALPTVYAEMNDETFMKKADVHNCRPEEINMLQELGYECYLHNARLFYGDNIRKQKKNVFGDIISMMALCVHPSTASLDLVPASLPKWSKDASLKRCSDTSLK